MTRPFLMISPHFPPSRLIGAKRGLTLARNLPRHGWDPAVIALPIDGNRDPALEARVPAVPIWRGFRGGPIAWFEEATQRQSAMRPADDQRAAKARPAAPSGLKARMRRELGGLPVDRYLKFQPWVIGGALRFLRRHRCELIHVSAGPFSGLALAYALAGLTGLPLVCDLRDPWAHDEIYRDAWTPTGQRIAAAVEAAVFRRAGRVVMNSEAALAHYREVYAGVLPAEHFACIRNHFDPELYDPAPPPPGREGPFTVVFFGHLTPVRDGALFFEAWRRFIDAEQLAPGRGDADHARRPQPRRSRSHRPPRARALRRDPPVDAVHRLARAARHRRSAARHHPPAPSPAHRRQALRLHGRAPPGVEHHREPRGGGHSSRDGARPRGAARGRGDRSRALGRARRQAPGNGADARSRGARAL
jgi:hypothetical protein